MDGRSAGLKLLGQLPNASTRSVKLDDLLPEFRRVRVPRSRHLNTFPLQSKGVHKTGGTPTPGDRGKNWVKGETEVPGLDQIDLAAKDWHAYDDSFGTDQESHFIKYLHDQADRLSEWDDDFHLFWNEKAVKLFAFADGQAFEPDFVLFLRKKGEDTTNTLQLFVEPKGGHLKQADSWKEAFLRDIEGQGRVETVFQGRDYAVYGLPFFNEQGQSNADFKSAFERFLEQV